MVSAPPEAGVAGPGGATGGRGRPAVRTQACTRVQEDPCRTPGGEGRHWLLRPPWLLNGEQTMPGLGARKKGTRDPGEETVAQGGSPRTRGKKARAF